AWVFTERNPDGSVQGFVAWPQPDPGADAVTAQGAAWSAPRPLSVGLAGASVVPRWACATGSRVVVATASGSHANSAPWGGSAALPVPGATTPCNVDAVG